MQARAELSGDGAQKKGQLVASRSKKGVSSETQGQNMLGQH